MIVILSGFDAFAVELPNNQSNLRFVVYCAFNVHDLFGVGWLAAVRCLGMGYLN